jgi:multimeric flavodoxin WrbA
MKSIKLLGISASPRKGNSLYYLEEAFRCLPELPLTTDAIVYSFHKKRFDGCTGCLSCYRNGGECIIKDDFEELRQMWIRADAVVYSVPVYVASIPGQMKSFIDRLHNSFWGFYDIPSMRHLKAIGFITQGLAMYGGQELAVQNLIMHATMINSIPVAPDGSYIAACGWTKGDSQKNASKKMAALESKEVELTLKIAQNVVRRVVEVAAIVKSGASALQDVLKADPRYGPYLERILTQDMPVNSTHENVFRDDEV